MMQARAGFSAAVACVFMSVGAMAADTPSSPIPEETPELVEQGRRIYIQRCSFCHGLMGDGNGPAADYMDPRPRDFTLGTFKFRTTQSGELPTNEDMFRTVSRGLQGTAMQAFDDAVIKNGLTEDQRWAVIAYIKTFAYEFKDPELDPYKMLVKLPDNRPASSPETIAKGREVFEQAKCWECHGKLGRGDGLESFDKTDDWGYPIRIRNVTHPWKIKAGGEIKDIYMRFSTGINGTPMPSFVDALSDEKRWYLATYIKSLQHQLADTDVLKVLSVEGDIPADPADPAWAKAQPMDVRLAGQVTVAPRWQNPGVEMVTVKAVYNDAEIAFLVTWDDPFEDRTHRADLELDPAGLAQVGAYNSYVAANDMVPRALNTYRDSVALQFPIKPVEGTRKPHFLRGTSSDPVNLWVWKADLDRAEEAVARGWKQPPKLQKEEEQQVISSAIWEEGRWNVIMRRPLLTEDRNDVQFVRGKFIPLALNAWDGSNGEHNLIMSLSTWRYVILEAPVPMKVYIYSLLAFLVTGGLGIWLMKKEQAS